MEKDLRYFVVLDFKDSSYQKIDEKFTSNNKFHNILKFSKDLHFTLLYLPNHDENKDEIVRYFEKKTQNLKDLKITVCSYRIWENNLILDVEKSKLLSKIHHSMVNDLPENLFCENKSFKSWNPHFGIAKLNPHFFSDETKANVANAVEEIASEVLDFKQIRVTRQLGQTFETLFSFKIA